MSFRSILIKPASGACNMYCDYCFYKDEQAHRDIELYGIMSKETAHKLIDRALANPDDCCTFAFQGGEPTLAGLDYYKDFISYANSFGKGRCSFALQTNGFCIDREWAKLFHDNNFLVGLSMDGPKKFHDIYRHSSLGEGSFKNVFRASQILKSEKVEFNILVTVTKDIAENIEEVHSFFVRNGFRYIQYIPCIDPIGSRGSERYSLSVEAYGNFLIKLFDIYYKAWESGNYTSVRYFDNLISMLIGNRPEACGMSGVCGISYVIEADGGVYPCDFYVLDDYRLGNIDSMDFSVLDERRREIGFIEKSMEVAAECKECYFFPLCRGGCRRDRDSFSSNLGLNYLCKAFKRFFSSSLPRLEIMARAELEARRKGK